MKQSVSPVALFAIVLWACTAVLSLGGAQQPEGNPRQSLTDESLQKMLDDMGYSPKKLSKGFLVSIKRDTWTYNMQLTLSPNGEKLGINANLGAIPKLEDVTAAQWLSLLESNQDIDPSTFYVDKTNQKLYLHRTMDNRAILPAYLRQQIDNFCSNIKSTEKAWSFTK